jgi:hypothetical protein
MRRLAKVLTFALLLAGAGGAQAGEGTPAAPAKVDPRALHVGKLDTVRLHVGALHLGSLEGVLLADAGTPPKGGGKGAAVKKPKDASCDVIEFAASKTGAKSVDDKLSKWKAELDQPPLSAFDTFKVTGAKSATISPGGTSSVQITANLTLLFKGAVSEGDKDRLQLEVTIDNAKGKRMYRSTTTQDSGASQILSAGKSGDANLFFVVTCSAQ